MEAEDNLQRERPGFPEVLDLHLEGPRGCDLLLPELNVRKQFALATGFVEPRAGGRLGQVGVRSSVCRD